MSLNQSSKFKEYKKILFRLKISFKMPIFAMPLVMAADIKR